MNLTYTNIVLKVGGQILLLVIGIMAITFGIESDWPSKNVDKMFSTTSITGVNTKTVTPVTNAIKATAVAVAVASSAKKNTVSSTEPEAKPEATVPAKTAAKPEATVSAKTAANPKATVKTKATAAAVASTIYKKILEKRKAAAAAK